MALQGIIATEHNDGDELLTKLGSLFQSKNTNWIVVDFSNWVKNVTLKFDKQMAFRVYDEFAEDVTEDEQGNLYVQTNLPGNDALKILMAGWLKPGSELYTCIIKRK